MELQITDNQLEKPVYGVTYHRQAGLDRFYVEFARSADQLNDDDRIVEGWVYSQGRVKSDRWNLPYEALCRSIPGYMEMPAVRSMHRSDLASGLALEMTPDDTTRRVKVVTKVVDDQEWRKCKEGVYRGFSLGGKPILARGNDISEFELHEISLVDRPADPGARFTMVRSEQLDEQEEYVVQVLPVEPVSEAESQPETPPAPSPTLETPTEVQPQGELAEGEVERVLTVEDVPVRENLEGPKVRRDKMGAVDAGAPDTGLTDCPHCGVAPVQRNGETGKCNVCRGDWPEVKRVLGDCCDSVPMPSTGTPGDNSFAGQADKAYENPTRRPKSFAELNAILLNEGLRDTFRSALWTLTDAVMSASDSQSRHQSVDEFSQFMHAWLGANEALRGALVRGEGLHADLDALAFQLANPSVTAALLARFDRIENLITTTAPEAVERSTAPRDPEQAGDVVARSEYNAVEVQRAEAVRQLEESQANYRQLEQDAELTRNQLSEAKAEIERLEKLKPGQERPHLYPGVQPETVERGAGDGQPVPAERTFAATQDINLGDAPTEDASPLVRLLTEQKEILARVSNPTELAKLSPAERQKQAERLTRIGMDLLAYGVVA